jgi:hypothetical protein
VKANRQPDDTAESTCCGATEEGEAQRECNLGQLLPGRSDQAARAPHVAIVAQRCVFIAGFCDLGDVASLSPDNPPETRGFSALWNAITCHKGVPQGTFWFITVNTRKRLTCSYTI